MPDRYLYFFVDLLCLLFPLVFTFHKRIRFHKQWKYFWLPCLLTAIVFISWDIIFTAKGVWSFNPRYVTGMWLAGLPVEEILFFLCIPYACVFTYYAIGLYVKSESKPKIVNVVTIVLVSSLLIVGICFPYKLYTSTTCFITAVLLFFLLYKKVKFLGRFYLSFLLILLPFFISNGVLTGSLTPEPVVSYNDDYNLGIRMITIPVEDIFYGMALLLMNVAGFEWMKKRAAAK